MSVCPVCDHENMPGMVFCTACGYRMDEGEPEGSRPSDGHSTVHLSDDSNDGEHGVDGTISDAATSHPVSDSANATEEPTKSGRRKIDPDSDAESEENSTQQPSTLSESETNNPLEGAETISTDGLGSTDAGKADDIGAGSVQAVQAMVHVDAQGQKIDVNSSSGSEGRRPSLLGALPEPPASPVSPLQFDDGGEAAFGNRWWLRPDSITPEERPDRTDEHDALIEASKHPAPVHAEQPGQSVKVPSKTVIELDRRRFDQLPTLQESEKSRTWMVAVVIGIAIIAVVVSLI